MLVAGWMTVSNAPSGLFSPLAVIEPLLETLRLQIHQDKSVVFPCEEGIRFAGLSRIRRRTGFWHRKT